MDRPTFNAAIKRTWLPALILIAAAIFGSSVYVRHHLPPTAEASVAVRDPLTVASSETAANASVPFDAIIKSDRLAAMVTRQLGPQAGKVKGALSVSVILPASGIDISPLYVVKATAPTEARAEAIVNAAIRQGRALFAELNSVDPKETTGALVPQLRDAKTALARATRAYNAFVAHAGGDHSAQIAALSNEVGTLTTQVAELRATIPTGTQTSTAAAALTNAQVSGLQGQLSSAESQLASLEPEQGQYTELSNALTQAQSNFKQLTTLDQQALATQEVPIADQVKVLDGAAPNSNGLKKILVYVLGVIIGLLAAFAVIYGEAVRQRSRVTPEQIVAAFGVPALGHIPRHALAREV
jgi:hypothetical protein